MNNKLAEINKYLSSSNNTKVLVIGDIILDEYVTCKASYSKAEEIKKWKVENNKFFLGGAANVASNISSLGGEVFLLGVIGNDFEGDVILELLHQVCNTSLILRDQERRTTIKTRYYIDQSETIRIDREDEIPLNESTKSGLIEQLKQLVVGVDCIIVSDYNKGVIENKVINEVLSLGKRLDKKVIVDPKGRAANKYAGATCITPNLIEFNDLTGESITDWKQAIPIATNFLKKFNIQYLLLTNSDLGSALFTTMGFRHLPALCNEVNSTIGAGDSLIAGLAMGFSIGLKDNDAFLLANLTSSAAVSKPFTTSITANDILNHIEQIKEAFLSESFLNELHSTMA
ncbi:bifunctional ADP-heptose synthase [Paenibacillus sp. KACC 21273]|uniref:bifunctional heptose 7-phosphate kinase/heptose 1-phosphate adenyltransferase n=1 Tax=Paenibacillus sp. KACC 21273 TaxID=3025665 RepID=UPI002365F0B7|nr:bifunctional ADP-heptose synthase [Paenibacillus sp. KACC 21273]WDF52843.1 bifunctional ADP-heptose synthase [Paenibacillus sp. KACC 21273]